MTTEDVYLSFLPLAHILDRVIEEYFFRKGASVGYYHGVCCLKIEPVHGKGRRKKYIFSVVPGKTTKHF